MAKIYELRLKTDDGIDICANHYISGFDTVIIICPGFLMHKDSKPFSMLSERLSRSFDIITMDFRGHGKSKGRYTFTSREHLDLRALVGFAKTRYTHTGVMGFSLGGAVAVNETAETKAVDRLLVISAPADFGLIENRFLTKDVLHSTVRKFDWAMGRTRLGSIFLKKPKPLENIHRISPIPILFVHGDKDTIVGPRHSELLYERAGNPKKIIMCKGCLHAEDVFAGDNFDNFISMCAEWFAPLKSRNDRGNTLNGRRRTFFQDLAEKRTSVRRYTKKEINAEDINLCLEAATLAPSACNSQPWKFIVVNDKALKKKLCEEALSGVYGMNSFAGAAPVIIAVVSEKSNFPARIGGQFRGTRYSLIDIGTACAHLILQAAELGIGSCILGWFNEKAVKRLLGIPRKKKVEVLISLGYCEKEDKQKRRKPLNEISSYNKYR